MYDHIITDNEIQEYFDGFSIRKNLVIKTSQLSNIDKIIDYCSEQEISDIVKVDYKSEDLEEINKKLFNEAYETSPVDINKYRGFAEKNEHFITMGLKLNPELTKL